MADEDHSDESLRHTLGLLVRPVREALFSESAPRDANRPWPPLPRRARRRVEGRVPFPLAAQLVDLGIALACFFGTYSLLMTETARLDKEVWSPLLMLSALVSAVPVALRERYPMAAWRIFVVGMILVGPYRWLDVPFAGGTAVTGILLTDPRNGGGTSFLVLLPLVAGYAVQYRRNARPARPARTWPRSARPRWTR